MRFALVIDHIRRLTRHQGMLVGTVLVGALLAGGTIATLVGAGRSSEP